MKKIILHAFNWNFIRIRKRLQEIFEAGYNCIQISPIQPSRDYDLSLTNTYDNWWKLYQPIGFSIAEKSWLGEKKDLIKLCKEAKKYNITIICDVVLNHMANNDTITGLNPEIQKYEPDIYNNYEACFHPYVPISDESTKNIVYGNIGMADLNTSNHFVQSRIISFLKECIDCGIGGFRFDASKHIETPDDGIYASDFWENIITFINNYSEEKMFLYGEVLNDCGHDRKISSYTKYMKVTDNRTSDQTLAGVHWEQDYVASNPNIINETSPENIILWAESHDTFLGTSGSASGIINTSNISTIDINKAWAIISARHGASTLYYVRPSEIMGKSQNASWKNSEVIEINKFANIFQNQKEYMSHTNKNVMIERYSSKTVPQNGAVIVNIDKNNSERPVHIQMPVYKISDGTYTDKLSGNVFIVKNNIISGLIGNTGIAVLY